MTTFSPLADWLRATDADLRLARAIRFCGGGLLHALQLTCRALEAYADISRLPRAVEWREACTDLIQRLERADAGNGSLLVAPSAGSENAVYSIFQAPPPVTLSETADRRVLALLGLLICAAASNNGSLPTLAVQGWATLRRAGRPRTNLHDDWRVLAANVPCTRPDLAAALQSTANATAQTLLQAALAAVDSPIASPLPLVGANPVQPPAPVEETDSTSERSHKKATDPYEASNDSDDESDEGGNKEVSSETKDNLLGWHIANANHARFSQRFNLPGDCDRLHPLTLKVVSKEMMASFATASKSDQDLLAIAHLSLRSRLPGRYVLEVSLIPGRYPYLDVANGQVVYLYRQLLGRNLDGATITFHEDEVEEIRIDLDVRIADHFRTRCREREGAARISGLLSLETAEQINAWLELYRANLRCYGDPAHAAYDARFATSAADVYRHTGSEVCAAIMAFDFAGIPMGLLHYLTLSQKYIFECERRFGDYLGFIFPERSGTGYKGTPISSTTTAEFQLGWRALQSKAQAARNRLEVADNARCAESAFNELSDCRRMTFVIVTLHRGAKLSRLTRGGICSLRGVLAMNDKDLGEYLSDRLFPITNILERLLAEIDEDVRLLQSTARRLGVSFVVDGRRAVKFNDPHTPAFLNVKLQFQEGRQEFARRILPASSLSSIAKECFGKEANVGRHFIPSRLVERGTPLWVVQSGTGHGRSHAEPFSDATSVSPALGMDVLRHHLEHLFDDLNLAPLAGGREARRRVIGPPSGQVPSPEGDPYLTPKFSDPYRILPPYCDRYTITALAVVDAARTKLAEGSPGLTGSSDFIACLMLFEGLNPDEQRKVFESLSDGGVVLYGRRAALVLQRDNCRNKISRIFTQRTEVSLATVGLTSPGRFRHHASRVGAWVKVEFPDVAWPADDFEAYLSLTACAMRWCRYVCNPDLLVAASPILPSATFTMRSLDRILRSPLEGAESSSLGQAVRFSGVRRSAHPITGPLALLAKSVRFVGDITRPIGEEIARANEWELRLAQVDVSGDERAKALRDYMREEIRLMKSRNPLADESSTLAGYVTEQVAALDLLSVGDSPAQMESDEIEDWVAKARTAIDRAGAETKAVKSNTVRYFGLKRLLKIGRRLGWAVPKALFDDQASGRPFDGDRQSAASIVVLCDDLDRIRRLVSEHFAEWPIVQRLSKAAAELAGLTLRSIEADVMRRNALVRSAGLLRIKHSGHSEAKSVHAPRLIPVEDHFTSTFDAVAQGEALGESDYIFLMDAGSDWSVVNEINEALVSAAVQVTGEAAFRRYSFRGSAVCRRSWPSWEQVAKGMLSRNLSPTALAKEVESWVSRSPSWFVRVSREAGHGHPLVTSVYYRANWTFELAVQLGGSLASLEPGHALIARVIGSTESLRKARSRAIKKGTPFSAWDYLAQRAIDHLRIPVLKSDTPPAILALRSPAQSAPQIAVPTAVRFAAEVLLGGDFDQRAHDNGIPIRLARQIQESLPSDTSAILARRRGQPSQNALAGDREVLSSSIGSRLLASLLAVPSQMIEALGADLSPQRPDARRPPCLPIALVARLQSHLSCLPPGLGLQIRFSTTHPRPLGSDQLIEIGSRLVVGPGNPRIGRQPQYQVIDLVRPKDAETCGRLTVLTRVLVVAAASVSNAFKGTAGEQRKI